MCSVYWVCGAAKMDKRTLSLIYMAQASDVIENAFSSLSDDEYEVATRRLRELAALDPEKEAAREGCSCELLWGVVSAFHK